MPTRDRAPDGAPCWIELVTSDTDGARSFYGALFGWTSEEAGEEYGGYINFFLDGVMVAGCMGKTPEMGEMPDVWTIYLATRDIDASVAAATDAGGQVAVPPMEIPALGRMGLVIDDGGAAIGLWQPEPFEGFGVVDEVGAPSWFELHTRDHDAAVKFYGSTFAWDTHLMSDDPEFRYTTFGEGEDQKAGIMDATSTLPEGVPAHWAVYFRVADADTTVARAVELGGSVLHAAEDTPYGRLAVLADPTGAAFRLVAG